MHDLLRFQSSTLQRRREKAELKNISINLIMPQTRNFMKGQPRFCGSYLFVQCLGLVTLTSIVVVNMMIVIPNIILIGNESSSFNVVGRKLKAFTTSSDYNYGYHHHYNRKKGATGSTNSSEYTSPYSFNNNGGRSDDGSLSRNDDALLLDKKKSSSGGDDVIIPAIVTFIDTRKPDSLKQQQQQQVHSPHQHYQDKSDEKITTTKATSNKYASLDMSLEEWRTAYIHACRNDKVDGEEIEEMSKNFFRPFSSIINKKRPPIGPTKTTTATTTKGKTINKHSNHDHDNNDSNKAVKQCRYTFLDLGANVGDSLGKFIDSGWDPCHKKNKATDGDGGVVDMTTTDNNDSNNRSYQWYPKYNTTTGIMDQFHMGDNVLVRFSRHFTRKGGLMNKKHQQPKYPESYCYYGLEGNPVFTPILQALEERIMMMMPSSSDDTTGTRTTTATTTTTTTTTSTAGGGQRPVARVHFFTETIAGGVDGPAILYLDTISKGNNFWGSSTLTNARFVKESAERDNHGKPIEARVQGMTLTNLIQQTTLREDGSHLLIKVDIEGGEWDVFQEVWESGILCDYTAHGVIVNMLVEKHSPQLTAAGLDVQLLDKFMDDLTKCGVVIQGGAGAGR